MDEIDSVLEKVRIKLRQNNK